MTKFNKYPSTDDSAESLIHRPNYPLNRNWNWSPKAPNSRHVIESINYSGDDHSLGNRPYEIIEASNIILLQELPDSNPKYEREQFISDEIADKHTELQRPKQQTSEAIDPFTVQLQS